MYNNFPGYCGFYFLIIPGSTGIYSGEHCYFVIMLPLCFISAGFQTAVRCNKRLTPLILIRVCSLTRQLDDLVYRCDQYTAQLKEETRQESVPLFSNCDFSYKQMATDHYWSSQDGEDYNSAARIFVPMKISFVLSYTV